MSNYNYHQLLKFLYFEGYADSYAEAEELLESMSDEEFGELIIVEYLFLEGYSDTIESAEIMAENISEDWVNEIIEKFNPNTQARGVRKKRGSKDINEKHVGTMDTSGRGPDHRTRFPQFIGRDDEFNPIFTRRRVRHNAKKKDPYYFGRRERKTERRQGTGGFNAE